ncbi:helix-turn-helix domain-containing protein [Herbiconiux sp. P18]|uniref:helix-turn-helix domain-containing protein n=1 Tax=Herbiconiux liangxiaofengii TaxID=3342795 RepID=UPI0035B750FE
MLLPSNPRCVLVQMNATTLEDAPAYRRMSRHDYGGLAMARIASVPQSVTAVLDDVPADAAESAQVQFVHSGRLILDQGDRQTAVGAGSLVVYDVSRPFEFVYPEEFRTTILQLPIAAIGATAGVLNSLSARAISPHSVYSPALSDLLRTADAHHDELTPAGRRAVSRSIVELVRLLAAEQAGALGANDTGRIGLAREAEAAVMARISDPGLSAAVVAAELHVSVRTLHAAFEDRRETLGQLIRRLRLDRARALLTSTELPVQGVAERVGYLDATHFIRSFKAAEGATPSQWRRRQYGRAT